MSLSPFTPPRYLPLFSSKPGVKVALPGSEFIIQAFPTALRVFLCRSDGFELVRELFFLKLGVPQDWRVVLDSMRRIVCIEGRGANGFFRIRIDETEDGLSLRPTKGPLEVQNHDQTTTLEKGEPLLLSQSAYVPVRFPMPRLLLGCNKAFNWDRISSSPEMNEVLPLWYQFGAASSLIEEPSSTLFGSVIQSIRTKDAKAIFPSFEALFRAGIEGMFVPKREDNLFLGYEMPVWPEEMQLSSVLNHVATAIRALFLTEEGSVVDLLPCLPCECVSGRLLHEKLFSGHTIIIEWRKSVLRRVLLRADHDGLVTFRASLRTGYLRTLRKPGRKKQIQLGEPIEVRQGEEYLLDNFST